MKNLLTFKKLYGLSIISIVYMLAVAGSIIFGVRVVKLLIDNGHGYIFGIDVDSIFLTIIFFVIIVPILLRILAESIAVFFKISEKLKHISELKAKKIARENIEQQDMNVVMKFLLIKVFYAPTFIRILYFLMIICCMIVGLILMYSPLQPPYTSNDNGVFYGIMVIVFGIIFSRVYTELLIIPFKIYEKVDLIEQQMLDNEEEYLEENISTNE